MYPSPPMMRTEGFSAMASQSTRERQEKGGDSRRKDGLAGDGTPGERKRSVQVVARESG